MQRFRPHGDVVIRIRRILLAAALQNNQSAFNVLCLLSVGTHAFVNVLDVCVLTFFPRMALEMVS